MADLPFRNRAFVTGGKPKRSFGEQMIREMRTGENKPAESPADISPTTTREKPSEAPSAPLTATDRAPAPGHTFRPQQTRYEPEAAPASMPAPETEDDRRRRVSPCYNPGKPNAFEDEPEAPENEVEAEKPTPDPLEAARARLDALSGGGVARERSKARGRLRKLEAASADVKTLKKRKIHTRKVKLTPGGNPHKNRCPPTPRGQKKTR